MFALILPWLQVDTPIEVVGSTVLPLHVALRDAGEYSASLEQATSYYFDSFRRTDREKPDSTSMVPVAPSVVLCGSEDDVSQASVSIDGLFFASMVNNSPYRYGNAINFVKHSVELLGVQGGPGFLRLSRTLFGTQRLSTEARFCVETRPSWCGNRAPSPNRDVLRLFEACCGSPAFGSIRPAITDLYEALSDNSTASERIEFAAYARAIEHLLHRSGQTRKKRAEEQKKLAVQLLSPMVDGLNRLRAVMAATDVTLSADRIVEGIQRVKSERNAALHPDKSPDSKSLYAQQTIRPNLYGFRVISALIIASMSSIAPEALTASARVRAVIEKGPASVIKVPPPKSAYLPAEWALPASGPRRAKRWFLPQSCPPVGSPRHDVGWVHGLGVF